MTEKHADTATHRQVQKRLRALADRATAAQAQRFFRTGLGDYGEDDRFLGIRVPVLRKLVGNYDDLPIDEIVQLLDSPWHEKRLFALLLLVRRYQRGDDAQRGRVYRLYMHHTARINNWDLVDASAEPIVRAHLASRRRRPLKTLARSSSIWERRIAVLATWHFIKRGELAPTLELAAMLLRDPHDLIHKAVGWMLREAGKQDEAALRAFLDAHASQMPRTMLRYAIMKMPRAITRLPSPGWHRATKPTTRSPASAWPTAPSWLSPSARNCTPCWTSSWMSRPCS